MGAFLFAREVAFARQLAAHLRAYNMGEAHKR
jgi:hypothetical protein